MERKMKWTALVAAALLTPGLAVAQPAPPPSTGDWNPDAFWRGAPEGPRERIEFLQDRINRGKQDGSLDPHEADRAQRELDGVRGWVRRSHYDNGGPLTAEQRDRIQGRLDAISRQIRWMRHDGW
jgi:hypothetical protein